MELQLSGKTGLVSGASSGIGRAIARVLGSEGVRLAITARREELLDELADEIEGLGASRPIVLVCDLEEPDAPVRLARAATEALGFIEILVNNAGQAWHLGLEATDEQWSQLFRLNFTRHRQLTDQLISSMCEHGFGRVLTIGGSGNPAKAALQVWAKNLARQVARFGVTVNSISPGKVMSEQIARDDPPEVRAGEAGRRIPVGHYGEPEDVANLACFLCSPLAHYITGTVFRVDGGMLPSGT